MFHPKLNNYTRPIENKYREGKLKRTLKRESKEPETLYRITPSHTIERIMCPNSGPRLSRCSGIGALKPSAITVGTLCGPYFGIRLTTVDQIIPRIKNSLGSVAGLGQRSPRNYNLGCT